MYIYMCMYMHTCTYIYQDASKTHVLFHSKVFNTVMYV